MKIRRPYSQVMPIAEKVVESLSPYCDRIEIAGSLRRQCKMVGDIEIIAIPTMHTNLFGEADKSLPAMLDHRLDALLAGAISHTSPRRWGSKLKSFMFTTSAGHEYQLDLFLQPDPATWGVNMMIRTGSADFSKKMVTRRSSGGWMPSNMFVKGARLWRDGEMLETPEEEMVFEQMGKDWVSPMKRGGDRSWAALK